MKYQNRILSGALLLCLILVIIAALAVGGEKADDGAPIQDISGQSIQILELCAKNETILADNRGNYPDYIELYNPGPPVNLKGYTLTNGEAVSPPLDQRGFMTVNIAGTDFSLVLHCDRCGKGFAAGCCTAIQYTHRFPYRDLGTHHA